MRILSEEEVFMTNVMANAMRNRSRGRREQTLLLEKRRNETTVLLRKLTFGTFYVLILLVAVKIAVMLWNDPMLITNLVQHYRSDSEMGCCGLLRMRMHMRLEFYVMRDLLKMALTSLF
ncbi:MAG: hypothetical protein PUB40_04195 [Lachnospiraceae bacterium]|nr:hypothetical protein [Lachnospiraceae bacterium]